MSSLAIQLAYSFMLLLTNLILWVYFNFILEKIGWAPTISIPSSKCFYISFKTMYSKHNNAVFILSKFHLFALCRARQCRWCIMLLHGHWKICRWMHTRKITSIFIALVTGKKSWIHPPIGVKRYLLGENSFCAFLSLV